MTTTPEPVDTGERAFPPVCASDERSLLTGMLEWYREGVLLKVAGISERDAAVSPVRSGTSVRGLVQHLALVEDVWSTRRFAGRPLPEPWASAPWDDDPAWDFHPAPEDRLEDLVALYRAACDRSRAALAGEDLSATGRHDDGTVISLRFVLVHLLEETARHLGHLDLLRELADGRTGE